MSVDWLKIKTEYVTTQISTRDLAQKHGVPYSTLRKRAEKENWSEERKKQGRKVSAKVAQKITETVACAQADRITQLMDFTQTSAELLGVRLEQMKRSGKVKSYEVKAITEALKNIRDLYRTDETAADDDPLVKYMEEMRRA